NMDIIITMVGGSHTVRVNPQDTVEQSREKRGVPASQQRLIHQGREMQGGKLEDYNVRNHRQFNMIHTPGSPCIQCPALRLTPQARHFS
uniref:Ubiquitin-like domain-containing protein n=1 Tax=Maylandia zebra TaxID=106582 RepID=A0A3P9CEQ2_9CICH